MPIFYVGGLPPLFCGNYPIDFTKMIEALIHEFKLVLHELCEERKEQRLTNNQIRKIMSAILDLSTAIDSTTNAQVLLANAITSAIAQLGSPDASNPQLVALTATVDAQNANIVDLTAQLNTALSGSTGAPVVTTQPVSQSVPVGGSVTFVSLASGALPLTYQWQFNGVDMPGETNANLTISNAQTASAGDYTVTATNDRGSSVSAAATVTIA